MILSAAASLAAMVRQSPCRTGSLASPAMTATGEIPVLVGRGCLLVSGRMLLLSSRLSGTSEDQDISTERGYSRVVPGKLTNDDD